MRSLEGQTALIAGGGTGLGRAIALALSARGVRIMVTGRDEKALGITVGEVVHGGGKARHLAGDPLDTPHLTAAIERAIDVFGRLDIVVAAEADAMAAECTLDAAWPQIRTPGRVLLAAPSTGKAGAQAAAATVADRVAAASAKRITCNAIVVEGALEIDATDDVASDVAELVVYLCGRVADGITGQTIAVRAADARA